MHSVLHMLTSPNERADEIPGLDEQLMQVQLSPLDGSVASRFKIKEGPAHKSSE